MFHSGQAEMVSATQTLVQSLGKSLSALPNRIVLSGHTDAVPFADGRNYDNWDLSSDRANATRRMFEASGIDRNRIIRVSGMADTQLLVPENPLAPSNRRISIMVQYRTEQDSAAAQPEPATKKAETSSQTPHREASLSPPATAPVDDQVFQNLRNALR